MTTDELVVPLGLHSRHLWLMLRVTVPDREDLRLVVDSGSVGSTVKEAVLEDLVARGRATFAGGRRFALQDVRVGGVLIPDIPVRAGGSAEGIDPDGIVGLEYWWQFDRVCVQTQPLQLHLTRPAAAPRLGL